MNVEKQLKQLGVHPAGGQHFLDSSSIVKALVEAGETDGRDVMEIGGGTGVVTEELSERANSVTVLETDSTLAGHLQQRFSETNVEVLEKDFLDYDIPDRIERCVSNLPFQITKEAVRKLGENQVQSSLILQEEVAEKMVADPGSQNYGYFTIVANYYFVPVKLRTVSSRNYYPEPDVDTSIVKLYPNRERHGVEDDERFLEVANALFTHSRKKVRNAFVDARHILEMEKEEAKQIRDELPHSEKRVNQLEVIDLKQIAEALGKH